MPIASWPSIYAPKATAPQGASELARGHRAQTTRRSQPYKSCEWRSCRLWTFDGEQWTTDEGVNESEVKRDDKTPRYEQSMPELQVIEIPLPRTNYVPPFPLP